MAAKQGMQRLGRWVSQLTTRSVILAVFASATVCLAQGQIQGAGYKSFPESIQDCVAKPPEDTAHKRVSPQPAQALSGTYDLCIDVRNLETNNTQMYWKQADSIRIVVFNNPFLYKYKIEANETPIADDDVLGKLGAPLGLPASSSDKSKPQPSSGAVKPFFENVAPPSECPALATTDDANVAAPKLACRARILEDELTRKQKAYEDFRSDVDKNVSTLRNEKEDLNAVWTTAADLRSKALDKFQQLTTISFETNLVEAARAAKFFQTNEEARLITAKANETATRAIAKVLAEKKGQNAKDIADQQAQIDKSVADQKTAQELVNTFDDIAARLAHTACVYQARKTGEFAAVSSQIYEPLSKILGNADNNPFRKEIRLGPYDDPTSVVVTLKRNTVPDELAGGAASSDNAEFACTSDSKTLLDNANHASTVDDLLPKNAVKRGSTDASNKVKPNNPADKPTSDQEATTVRLKQPLTFGGARLVVTGGLTAGVLRKQEFQRTVTLAGPTVVGLKTDSPVRLSPMLFGHTRLWAGQHSSDAWYATLGVTANSDNKGVSPEFMLGASRSLAQQKFFLSAGVYLGEQQKLDGGLHVGDVIPTSFTGEIPVTKSYRAGFAFSLSYRFASTKDPKSNTPSQPSQQTKPKSGQ